MMRSASVFAVVLLFHGFALAASSDPGLAQVQQALRQQGFYYGQSDGVMGDETQHAIRRFQIRNGLTVSGKLDDATRQAILKASESEPALPSEDRSDLRPPSISTVPPKTVEEDKAYLNTPPPTKKPSLPVKPAPEFQSPNKPKSKKTASRPPSNLSPSVREDLPFFGLFNQSPMENASKQEQQRIVLAVQGYLSRYGYRPGPVDGSPGASTIDALLRYQAAAELPRSGTLDGATLELMGLLPPGKYRPDRYDNRERRGYAREYQEPVYYYYGPSVSPGWY